MSKLPSGIKCWSCKKLDNAKKPIAFFIQTLGVILSDFLKLNKKISIKYASIILAILFLLSYIAIKEVTYKSGKKDCVKYLKLHIDSMQSISHENNFWAELNDPGNKEELYFRNIADLLFIEKTEMSDVDLLKAKIKKTLNENHPRNFELMS